MYSKQMIERIRFFKAHAGYVVGQAMLSALYYAKAEEKGEELELSVEWEYDQYSTPEDLIDTVAFPDAVKKFQSGEWEAYNAFVKDESGEIIASLGGIILTADSDDYKRTVEAELMAEAIETIMKGV